MGASVDHGLVGGRVAGTVVVLLEQVLVGVLQRGSGTLLVGRLHAGNGLLLWCLGDFAGCLLLRLGSRRRAGALRLALLLG